MPPPFHWVIARALWKSLGKNGVDVDVDTKQEAACPMEEEEVEAEVDKAQQTFRGPTNSATAKPTRDRILLDIDSSSERFRVSGSRPLQRDKEDRGPAGRSCSKNAAESQSRRQKVWFHDFEFSRPS